MKEQVKSEVSHEKGDTKTSHPHLGPQLVPVATSATSSGGFVEDLHDKPSVEGYRISLAGVFLPVADADLAYDQMVTPWEDAFAKYLSLSTIEFFELLPHAQGAQDNGPDFLKVAWEDLFNIPVNPALESAYEIIQVHSSIGVDSLANVLDIEAVESLARNLNYYVQVVSIPETLSISSSTNIVPTILLPFIAAPSEPVPSTPDFNFNPSVVETGNGSIPPISEFYLNVYQNIEVRGNIFNGPFGYDVGASAGPGATVASIAASLSSSNIAGGSVSFPTTGEEVLTTAQGNTFTFFSLSVDGHQAGDFFYTLNNAILTPPNPTAVFESFTGFIDLFLYAITNNFLNTGVGGLFFKIIDDKPVASSEINTTAISEAHIPAIGSAAQVAPVQLAGTLLTTLTPTGTLIVDPANTSTPNTLPAGSTYFGANGGHVLSLTFAGNANAAPVTALINNGSTTMSASDIAFLASKGFSGSNVGDAALEVKDSLGNTMVVDTVTGQYVYTLNNPYSNTVQATASPETNQPASISYYFQLIDNEGQTTPANTSMVTLSNIIDDTPIAVAVAGSPINEANIQTVGSNGSATVDQITGNILTGGNILGADGEFTSGGVTAVFHQVIGGTQDGTTAITGTSNVPHTLTAAEVAQLGGSSSVSDAAQLITDNLNNTLLLDEVTGRYIFTLNNAVHNNTSGVASTYEYTFTLKDKDGSTVSQDVSISVNDDGPTAVAVTASPINESDIQTVGSNGSATVDKITGNILTGGNVFGADGELAAGGVTAVFHQVVGATTDGVTAILGTSNVAHTLTAAEVAQLGGSSSVSDAAQLITDNLNNTLLLDEVTGRYIFTLNNAVHNNTSGVDATYEYTFTLKDKDGTIASQDVNISVNDDGPKAVAVTASPINEADIQTVGSNGSATVDQITGNILTGGNIFGADKESAVGGVTAVFHQVVGATTDGSTAISGTSNVAHTLTAAEVAQLGGSSSVSDAAQLITDNLNNTLLLDEVTGRYIFTLNNAVHNNTSGVDATYEYTFTLKDKDGTIASQDVNISVNDDGPKAVAVTASPINEADIQTVGSNGSATVDQITGNILTGGNIFGADKESAVGGVTAVFHQVVGATTDGSTAISGTSNVAHTLTAAEVAQLGGSSSVSDAAQLITDNLNNTFLLDEVTGRYIFTLNTAVHNNTSGVDATYEYTFTLKDKDGTTASKDVSIAVSDDAPIAHAASGTVFSAGLPGGSAEGVAAVLSTSNLGNTFGADGPAAVNPLIFTNFSSTGETISAAALSTTTITVAAGNPYGFTVGDTAVVTHDPYGNAFAIDLNNFKAAFILSTAVQYTSSVGTETFGYTQKDADGSTASNTITETINNDPPVINNATSSVNYTDDQVGSVVINNALAITDGDSPNLIGATIKISAGFATGDELNFTDTVNISGSYNALTGLLTLSGTDTLADYQAALHSITFSSSNANATDFGAISSATISWQVTDTQAVNNQNPVVTSTVNVFNAAPEITPSSTAESYTDGQTGVTTLDPTIAITDTDSLKFASAKIDISSNFAAGDQLNFTDTANITGSYNALTGVLTLTGADTVADYNAALQSITFSSSNGNATNNGSFSSVGIDWQVSDINSPNTLSNVGSSSLTVVNAAPTVTPSSTAESYTDGQTGATTLDPTIAITDTDSLKFASAKIDISSNFAAGDQLNFTDTANITGSYNALTGVLTLTGADTVADYNAALQSITFSSSNGNATNNGSFSSVGIDWQVSDINSPNILSNVGSSSLTVVNAAPTVTPSSTAESYTDGQTGATTLDPTIAITDTDSLKFASAKIDISSNFAAGDQLNFTDTANITGSYNALTGVLTLTGADTVADYNAALQSITFSSSNGNATNNGSFSSVGIDWQVSDINSPNILSNVGSSSLTVVNAAPTVTPSSTAESYTDGQTGATTLDPTIAITDTDSLKFASAKIDISSNFAAGDQLNFTDTANITGSYNALTGVLTLTGADTVADYNAALQSITFSSSNGNATNNGSFSSVGIDWQVSDINSPNTLSNVGSSSLTVVNAAPTVTPSSTAESYTDGQTGATTLDPTIAITDTDSLKFASAKIDISSNFAAGDQLNFTDTANITGSYNALTGVLTLTGADTVADYNAALQSITFSSSNGNATNNGSFSSVGIDWQVSDINSPNILSNVGSSSLTVVNAAPTVTPSSTAESYTDGQTGATTLDPTIAITDTDSLKFASAKIDISSNFAAGDQLNFTDTANITGSYNALTGVLTLTGADTVADYNAALQSITFSSSNGNATNNGSFSSVGIDWQVSDINSPNILSNVGSSSLTVVNAAPTVTPSSTAESYTDGQTGATTLDPTIAITDTDSLKFASAKIDISSNFAAGDQLNFTDTANITGSYNALTGVLTLTGADTVADYNAALQSITFSSSNGNATNNGSFSSVGIDWQVSDINSPNTLSNVGSSSLTVVNAAPVVTPSSTAESYTDGQTGATTLDPTIAITDTDSLKFASAKIDISSNFAAGDQLNFTDTANITGSYNALTGVLTLTGADTVADYNAALQSITFSSSNGNATNNGSFSSVGIDWQVSDINSPNTLSNVGSSSLTVVNAAPTVTPSSTAESYTDGQTGATTLDPTIAITDTDSLKFASAKIDISSNFAAGDQLNFTDTANITGSYNALTGVLTLTGADTVADYNAALQSITFSSSNGNATNNGTVASIGIDWQVTDINSPSASNVATSSLAVVNAAPVVTVSGIPVDYSQSAATPVTLDGTLALSDSDNLNLASATVKISSGFAVGDFLTDAIVAGITSLYDPTTGILTLSGSASLANYQTELDSVQFSSINPISSRTITWQVDDGEAINHASNQANTLVNIVAPVVLDLSGAGIHLLSPSQSPETLGQLSGTNNASPVGWITPGEGVLMLDANGNGSITNINQISFTSYLPGAKTDLQGLIAFDTNHDGKLDIGDQQFSKFGVLLANGKFESLSQLNITAISLTSDHHQETMNGNTIFGFTNFQTVDGKSHLAADTAFAIGPSSKGATIHTHDVLSPKNHIDFSKLPEVSHTQAATPAAVSNAAGSVSASPTHEAGVANANAVHNLVEHLTPTHHENHHG